MVKRTTPPDFISAQDVLRTEVIINQALIDILIAKQVITEEELVKSIKNIKRDHQKLLNESSKIVTLKR
ncbi:MAG: hypothetical protein AMJ60_05495 [Desulfobacterales bacterium SG8_35]|nr:MAG: hypothetical protein AMJ60_05495 [Desulfobacterales bacterium SG8_35]